MADTMTRNEALQQLSKQLRREGLEDGMFVRLLTAYATLQGWIRKGQR